MIRFFPSAGEDREEAKPSKRFLEIKDPYWETESWNPLEVSESIPPRIRFVDGVRRTEYRVNIFDGDRFAGEGIFLSLGAGVVEVDLSGVRPEYRLLLWKVERFFVHNAEGVEIPPSWRLETDGGLLEFKTVKSPIAEISEYGNLLMKKLEVSTFRETDDGETPVVMDGPVKLKKFLPNVVYLVKEAKYFYLKGFEKYLFTLKRGYRTPFFLFEEGVKTLSDKGFIDRKVSKVGGYVRIGGDNSHGGFGDPLGGLARLEIPHGGDRNLSKKILERGAAIAVFFANRSLRDARSPQNLTTIAYLEKELRRRLGEYKVIRRMVGNLLLSLLG